MDFKRLEIFCRVVELKSFTRAAEASLLTQPTVSENIRLLEEALDERLLDRLAGRSCRPRPGRSSIATPGASSSCARRPARPWPSTGDGFAANC